MKPKLPQEVKVCLWSYNTDKMSLSNLDHRFIITMNVLNYGAEKAVEWLLKNFSEKEIKETIKKSYGSEWNKKSLSFWSLIFNAFPHHKSRFAKLYGTSLEYSR